MTACGSLHDIAPRLAVARDIERWNIWCAGDEPGIKNGDRWAEIVGHPEHRTERCRHCGETADYYTFAQRLLYGANKGYISRTTSLKCRRCRAGGSTHR